MQLNFTTADYAETAIFVTIGSRHSSADDWTFSPFVPSRAMLHTDSEDSRTLLTVMFKARSPRHAARA